VRGRGKEVVEYAMKVKKVEIDRLRRVQQRGRSKIALEAFRSSTSSVVEALRRWTTRHTVSRATQSTWQG